MHHDPDRRTYAEPPEGQRTHAFPGERVREHRHCQGCAHAHALCEQCPQCGGWFCATWPHCANKHQCAPPEAA